MKKLAVIISAFALSVPLAVDAASFSDTFANGINPTNWLVLTNDPLFSVTTPTPGTVFISKPASTNQTFHYAIVACHVVARGDFTAQIDFTNANLQLVSGTPGDQLQLDCRFGGQDFLVVRSDEASLGQNAHVYLNPPGNDLVGTTGSSVTSGTLKVVRSGTLVSGYIGSTLLYQANYNTNDATFAFCLQNNGTDDAMSADFGNFQLTADGLTNTPPNVQIQLQSPNVILSWPNRAWPDYLSPNDLQSTPALSGKNGVADNIVTSTNGVYLFTNSATSVDSFYRLKMGP